MAVPPTIQITDQMHQTMLYTKIISVPNRLDILEKYFLSEAIRLRDCNCINNEQMLDMFSLIKLWRKYDLAGLHLAPLITKIIHRK